MTQEDKQLLLVDLCARLPYRVMCHINGDDTNTSRKLSRIEVDELDGILLDFWTDREDYLSVQVYLSEVKPYLRPMSSMTEEEKQELYNFDDYESISWVDSEEICFKNITISFDLYTRIIDWLNSNHFDYRGLIGKYLAIEVTKENNPYKK